MKRYQAIDKEYFKNYPLSEQNKVLDSAFHCPTNDMPLLI